VPAQPTVSPWAMERVRTEPGCVHPMVKIGWTS